MHHHLPCHVLPAATCHAPPLTMHHLPPCTPQAYQLAAAHTAAAGRPHPSLAGLVVRGAAPWKRTRVGVPAVNAPNATAVPPTAGVPAAADAPGTVSPCITSQSGCKHLPTQPFSQPTQCTLTGAGAALQPQGYGREARRGVRPDPYVMCVGNPASHGVVHPAGHALAVWQAAVEVVVMVLRVAGVAAAQRVGASAGLALHSRPLDTRPRKGERGAGSAHRVGGGGGGSCSSCSSGSESEGSDAGRP